MTADPTAAFAIQGAEDALQRARAAAGSSHEALRGAIEAVWWVSAGAEHLRATKDLGTRLSALYWVRNRGLHQTASLVGITEDVTGGYAGGYAGGYGGAWAWMDRAAISNVPKDRPDKNRDADFDRFLARRGVLETVGSGLAELRKITDAS